MNPEKHKAFEEFKSGDLRLWVLSTQGEDDKVHPLVQKIDEARLGLPAWRERAEAEEYLANSVGLSGCTVESVNFSELQEALNRFDEQMRRRISLALN